MRPAAFGTGSPEPPEPIVVPPDPDPDPLPLVVPVRGWFLLVLSVADRQPFAMIAAITTSNSVGAWVTRSLWVLIICSPPVL
jgi:hypothetical protein